ncbi:Uncharacterized protein FWK35_00003100 [Aphis craccivora]|uniref:Uncharacterized protein n=1 Tax=Aphis craccivora TaxID=307492 RepID=A0A6G0ZQH0_APHCR|nr:Uncharacterized protein FWK35_00003100 [Aphis craccivora]
MTIKTSLMKRIRNNSERSEECIDFTMIITSRNNAPITNFGGGFRCVSKYPWYIIQVKTFSNSFQKNREKQKKMTEKRDFLRKTSFRPNRFFFMIVIQKLITFTFLRNLSKTRKFTSNFEVEKSVPNDNDIYPQTILNICHYSKMIHTAPNVQQSGTHLPTFFFCQFP